MTPFDEAVSDRRLSSESPWLARMEKLKHAYEAGGMYYLYTVCTVFEFP
jgi:hypothetical protein